MYVCICNGVTDKTIKKAFKDGYQTEEEITMKTGAGNCCGSCVDMVNDIIEECSDDLSLMASKANDDLLDINPLSIAAFKSSNYKSLAGSNLSKKKFNLK